MTAYTDFHYSPTGSGVISGVQVLEQTEQGINGLGQYVQDNVSGAIDTANQALTIAQTADSNATLALNTANSFASAISAANNTANNALTTAQSAQNTANTASSLATTANNNANTALNAANTATANVGTLTNSVNALGNRMTTAENAISTNAGNITTLQTNLQTTNNNVTAAANAASAAQATATSAQSTATLARNQAYVLRYTGTTITGGGTIAYADIDNTDNIKAGDKIIDATGAIYDIASVDTANQTVTVGASLVINLFCDAENLIPAANDAYDLGSSSYQWNNLYAKNYYYSGTPWGLDKANTWTNTNAFNILSLYNNSVTYNEAPSNNTELPSIRIFGGGKYCGAFDYLWRTTGENVIRLSLGSYKSDGSFGYWACNFGVPRDFSNGGSFGTPAFYPNTDGYNLGDSTHRWKTLNGINPGALSLPDLSVYQNVDTTGWLYNGTTLNSVLLNSGDTNVTKNGWLYIRTNNTVAGDRVAVRLKNVTAEDPTTIAGEIGFGHIEIFVPIVAGYQAYVFTNKAPTYIKFYPCLGNVPSGV